MPKKQPSPEEKARELESKQKALQTQFQETQGAVLLQLASLQTLRRQMAEISVPLAEVRRSGEAPPPVMATEEDIMRIEAYGQTLPQPFVPSVVPTAPYVPEPSVPVEEEE